MHVINDPDPPHFFFERNDSASLFSRFFLLTNIGRKLINTLISLDQNE